MVHEPRYPLRAWQWTVARTAWLYSGLFDGHRHECWALSERHGLFTDICPSALLSVQMTGCVLCALGKRWYLHFITVCGRIADPISYEVKRGHARVSVVVCVPGCACIMVAQPCTKEEAPPGTCSSDIRPLYRLTTSSAPVAPEASDHPLLYLNFASLTAVSFCTRGKRA